MARACRTALGLFVVAVAYTLYAATVVPLVEPTAAGPSAAGVSAEERSAALHRNALRQRADLTAWFKPGDWELTSPKIVETSQGKLLWRDQRNLPDGEVEIKPCTIILLPADPSLQPQQRMRRAVILRSASGAILKFDSPLEIERARFGKLIGGRLLGEVVVYSDQRMVGPEDDLRIRARDLVMSAGSVTSKHAVEFALGKNRGSGRDLEITMETEKDSAQAAGFGGVTSVSLAHDVTLRLHTGGGEFFPGDVVAAGNQVAQAPGQQDDTRPIDISCQGPFRFDLARYVARFERDVIVRREQPGLPTDQLRCEQLDIEFDALQDAPAAPSAPSNRRLPKLSPRKLVATGNPVELISPTNGIQAQGEILEYDIQRKSGGIRDKTEAVIIQDRADVGRREVHAIDLKFEPSDVDPAGNVVANGAGWLAARVPGDRPTLVRVSWSRGLRLRPDGQQQLLSVEGDSHVEAEDFGLMQADEIHLWLDRVTDSGAAPSPGRMSPDRLLADGNVRFSSPQWSGQFQSLQLWFEPMAEPSTVDPLEATEDIPPHVPPPSQASKPSRLATTDRAPAAGWRSGRAAGVTEDRSRQRFVMEGDLLQAQILTGKSASRLVEARVKGGVSCRQINSTEDMQGLVLSGNELTLSQADERSSIATLVGQPARAEGRGLVLVSGSSKLNGSIVLDRVKNKVWTNGAGNLVLPRRNVPDSSTSLGTEGMSVAWQGKMSFDGKLARFDHQVRAQMRSRRDAQDVRQSLETEVLEVVFRERLRFDGKSPARDPEVAVVRAPGPFILNRQTSDSGELHETTRLTAMDLQLDERTGRVTAAGPGHVRSVQRRAGDPLGLEGNPGESRASQDRPENIDATGLVYLAIDFEHAAEGNLRDERLLFRDSVRACYGPVTDWQQDLDPEHPELLGERGFVLTCRQLEVVQRRATSAGAASLELMARENTLVEGQDFTARAYQLTYDQSKQQLVLEGDGRSDAFLSRHETPGARPTEVYARRITYWHATRRVKWDDFKSVDLSGLEAELPRR